MKNWVAVPLLYIFSVYCLWTMRTTFGFILWIVSFYLCVYLLAKE